LTKKMHKAWGFIWKIKRYWTRKLRKKEIIAAIAVLATVKVNAHSMHLKMESLRTAFSAGKVPSEVNEKPGPI
jgi:hypothetical protein